MVAQLASQLILRARRARANASEKKRRRGGKIKREETRSPAFPNRGSKVLKICIWVLSSNEKPGMKFCIRPTFFSLFFFSPRIDTSLRKRTYVRTWKNRIIRNIEFRISKNFLPISTNFISSLRLKRAFNYYNEICPRAG